MKRLVGSSSKPAGAGSSDGNNDGDEDREFVGCIGKCGTGVGLAELDRITDHVQHALDSAKGRAMFRSYLGQARRRTDLACLDLYENCCDFLARDERRRLSGSESSLEPLLADLNLALSAAEQLDDVPAIDLALLERYTAALEAPRTSRSAMLELLEETKIRMMNSLAQAHGGFRRYARQPCPRTRH